ncbi:SDR family oxidoreductase [Ostreiculturibacter nitratireducens]|uniref:SDR family oxidoreductase n=1 Tax=Ostreiculturibacter nitratireducens TaxID=3075226 RepID=UPI0031B64D32
MKRYADTTAIVTGAAHGIGRAIARRLAAEGANVAVLDIDGDGADETARILRKDGNRAQAFRTDITDFPALEGTFAEIEANLGPVGLLVNNAAYTDAGALEGMGLDAWHREVDVNLNGTYHCLRAILPRMKERMDGAVVNIASVNGVRYFGNPSYSAAKAGIINLTQSVASEYGKYGIRCNAVLPGSVRTDNVTWTIRQQKDPDIFKKLGRWYALGRVAEPDDIAKAVSFLGSDDAGYITGVALPVDGGLLAGMNVMIGEFVLESDKE